MLKAVIIAFSTYSKIPMPHLEWKKEDMRYTMCAFPLVGVLIALAEYEAYTALTCFGAGYVLSAAVMTLLPILITGGIHMDGYMDTWDALSSYGDKDKKLSILKDPHVGAFAVIHCICYIMLTFALWHELISRTGEGLRDVTALYTVLSGFVLSRILSGLYAVSMKKARKNGMLNDVTEAHDNKCVGILLVQLLLFFVLSGLVFGICSFLSLIPAIMVSGVYKHVSYKLFDGITGDLAGWFLQVLELAILMIFTFIR